MWRELGDLHHGLVQESSEVMLISVRGSVPYEKFSHQLVLLIAISCHLVNKTSFQATKVK